VEGTLRLARGTLVFDAEAGTASGEIAVDARSAETRNERRDASMHRDVLESAEFPTIAFRAERLEVARRDATSADVRLVGRLELHGATRPFDIPARVEARDGGRVAISAAFRVPYVDWGVADASTWLLRVERFVDVSVEAEALLAPP